MSILGLGIAGGFISFLSTSIGVVMTRFIPANGISKGGNRFSLPIDFALGVMVAASAFSLIGPAAVGAEAGGHSVSLVIFWTLMGALAVFLLKKMVDISQAHGDDSLCNKRRFILASVLMLHNFPEGLASGAAVAGLGWQGSLGILGAISLQNVPEGALMVICLSALGWSSRASLLGGFASGGVELFGGLVAGLLLGVTVNILPYLLGLAGGAMIASVLVELLAQKNSFWTRVVSRQFAAGFIGLTVLQILQQL